jgi:hypothetical protein
MDRIRILGGRRLNGVLRPRRGPGEVPAYTVRLIEDVHVRFLISK